MKSYLSFGGGVNSVAMMLMLLDQGAEFETIFVDHGTDHPETYEYFDMFQRWLKKRCYDQITVLKPNRRGFTYLYDYCLHYSMVPSFMFRWCTVEFKVSVIYKYVTVPCFMMIGFSVDESKRAKISSNKGIENRFPLIENEITRKGCVEIIKAYGLPVPMKSGCYICPYQSKGQWMGLRMKHPDLFCKAQQLENKNIRYRISKGKRPLTLSIKGKKLSVLAEEKQARLFDEYPPCNCEL